MKKSGTFRTPITSREILMEDVLDGGGGGEGLRDFLLAIKCIVQDGGANTTRLLKYRLWFLFVCLLGNSKEGGSIVYLNLDKEVKYPQSISYPR